MVIFRQAMMKYLKAPSTWIILILSLFISGFLAGYLPFDPFFGKGLAKKYGYSVLMSTGIMTTMVSMFSSIFAGFKGASMFRDEIESGTFLVLLSKPISRTKIVLEKWLALQVMMVIFAVANIVVYEIVIVFVDNYSSFASVSAYGTQSISKNIFTVCGYMFLVLFTMGLIFSSIAMILSTKLSTATTIGISIGIGVIIPITGMIGAFTQKQEFTQLNNQTSPNFKKSYLEMESSMGSKINFSGLNDALEMVDDAFAFAKDPKQGIYNIGIKDADNDKFSSYFPLDLNYQLELLGAISTKDIIPTEYKQSLTSMGIMSQLAPIIKDKKDGSFDYSKWSTVDGASSDVFNKVVAEAKKMILAGNAIAVWLHGHGLLTTEHYDTHPDSAFISGDAWVAINPDNNKALEGVEAQTHDLIYKTINVLFSEKKLAEVQKDSWDKTVNTKYNYESYRAELRKDPLLMGLWTETMQSDSDAYQYLMNIVANDRQELVYIKLGDYVPKWTLFWCYLAFALGLVPISLLIMRKKDFR